MIRTNNRGGGFFLDIRNAQFIPTSVMSHVEANVARAVKMMPAQDILDLAINGAPLVRDLEDNRDQAIMAAEKQLKENQQLIQSLQVEIKSLKTANTGGK